MAGIARRLARRLLPAPARDAARTATGQQREQPGPGGRAPDRLARRLERGDPVPGAILAEVRALAAEREFGRAESIAASLAAHPDTGVLGRLAAGIVASRRGFVELAWDQLRPVPRADWVVAAPAEYTRAGLALAPQDTLDEIRGLVAEAPEGVPARSWYEILAAVFGFGAQELARDVFAVFDRRVDEDGAWPAARMHRDWMHPWVAADAGSPTRPQPDGGRRTIAVMDYGHPGAERASANIGDHIQSIAALGHLVRHQNVRLQGDENLVALLEGLRTRTRPQRRSDRIDADVEVISVHRDASMYEAIAQDTWVVCFGWYMHALFGMRHGFPLHHNLRPIFVSFHCNKRDLLTPDAIAYLKRFGPVGCRDWTTVYLLLSCGVPAFFSGCVTTTIDTLFEDASPGPGPDAPIAYVDVAPKDVPAGAATYAHSSGAVRRRRSFVENVHRAVDLLETYRREHRAVVTTRLHCYLPLRSIGVPVDFRPKNRSDVRFDGLIDLDDDGFDAIRDGLLSKLERVHEAILGGRPEAEVYELWRGLTAADVAAAEQRASRKPRLARSADVPGRALSASEHAVTHTGPAPGAVHCAIFLPRRGGLAASALIASLLEHASRPLHFWLLAPPGTGTIGQRLAERFPGAGFSTIALSGLRRGLRTPTGEPPGLTDVARLLLGDLLPGVDRAVVLPLPSVATGDVAALAGLDLGSHAFAAPTRPGANAVSGFGVIHGAAARLRDRTGAAAELRRTAHARHRFDFDAFTTDVLVADLDRLRRDGLSGEALPLVEAFGLRAAEALHFLAGPDRATVPAAWATVPTRMPPGGPGLVFWADHVKPSHAAFTPERDRWRAYAAAFDAPAATR